PPAATARPRSADDVYAEAEAAMRRGDDARARVLLDLVARQFAADPLVDSALYDLARLAVRAREPARARAPVEERIARARDPALRGPPHYLQCRLAFDERRERVAAACLAAFRRDFPSSPHDAEALALLASLTQAAGDCARARPLLDEYLRRY